MKTRIEIPENVITEASHTAYEEDSFQIVGQNESGEWVYRDIEDPESDTLRNSVRVGSSGIVD